MTDRSSIVAGLKWSAIGRIGAQLVSWLVTIAVMRILEPADYGLMAIVAVMVSLLSGISEFGLGTALIQARQLDDERAGAVFGAMLLLSLAICAVMAAAGGTIANFYAEPRLQALVPVAAFQFVLASLVVVPDAMLRRSMDFKRIAMVEMAAALVASTTTLALAMSGAGVWSLVLGSLAGAVVGAIVMNAFASHWVRPNLRLQKYRELMKFGGYVAAGRIVAQLMSQADVLLGSKFLSKEALGLYSVSIHLAALPMSKAMSLTNQVGLSAISRHQDDLPTVRKGMADALRALAYVTFPLMAGLACVAPELISVVLGPDWKGAVPMLQIVAWVMPLRMIGSLFSTAMVGLGRSDVDFRNTLTGLVVMPLCFLVGVQWGAVGLAAAWTIGVPVVLMLNYRRIRRVVGLRVRDVVVAVGHPFVATAAMVGGLVGTKAIITDVLPRAATLVLVVAIGSALYFAVACLLDSRLRAALGATAPAQRIRALLAGGVRLGG